MNVLIKCTDDAFGRMMWREGLHSGFFTMQILRDSYRDWCGRTGTPMHAALLMRFMHMQTVILTPVCPHFAEHTWALLGESG
ncbi:unnamed protein product, partial [Choristocarpus tenellus]